jgi:hypothetical protein
MLMKNENEKASGVSKCLRAGRHASPYPPLDKAYATPFPRKGGWEKTVFKMFPRANCMRDSVH